MRGQRNIDASDKVPVTHTVMKPRSEAVAMIDSSDFLIPKEVSHVV